MQSCKRVRLKDSAINTDVEKGQRRFLGYSSAMTRPGRKDCDAVMKCASHPIVPKWFVKKLAFAVVKSFELEGNLPVGKMTSIA